MPDPENREDLSRFVVHLTRRTEDSSAVDVLAEILTTKQISARNAHCLFKYEFDRLNFSECLTGALRTACFTETPLTQIRELANPDIDRQVKLEPYGVVFSKQFLIEQGGNPAIYINSHDDDSVKQMLLRDFRNKCKNTRTFKQFKRRYLATYEARLKYYSLINVVQPNHDFMWEREWRHTGDMRFKYFDVVAVICPSPQKLLRLAKKKMTVKQFAYLDRMPIINADWTFEDIVDEMSEKLWENARRDKISRR